MATQIRTPETVYSLKLDRGAWLVRRVEVLKWGTEIVVHGVYNPDEEENTRFQLIFKNCQHLTWDTMGNDYDPRDTMADVIGFDIYEEQRESVIHTDLFELIIKHDELLLHKDW
ncbi:MAG: hypothetical protein HZC41_09895 [Chloroflexi bacterium]|nr:hypothetical protein [Chloroflexota bacterium]